MGSLLYRERRLLWLVVGLVVAIGATALLTIGRQEDPTITNLFATVVTPYPGADPGRVEALVTEKIEEELREIEEIKEIASTSRTGISVVTIELSEFLTETEIEQSWSEIRDALADASLAFPSGVPEPDMDDDRTGAYTAISALVARDGRSVPSAFLRRYAEVLQDRMRGLQGTEISRLFGVPEEEILVEVAPRRLISLGLTVDEVADAIRLADSKVESGRVRGSGEDFIIEVAGEIDSLERIRQVIVANDSNGAAVRVGDVATVARAVREPVATQAFTDGEAAVFVATRMEPDLQVDAWMARVRGAIAEFEAELPDGIEHRLIFDQSGYTADRLEGLVQNLAIGVSLVVLVLIVSLGWRAAMVVAAILPLTSLASLAILQKLGVPIHQMSVTGLIVALGLLVDAAIVMTDEVRRRLEAGENRVEAVTDAVRRLRGPLLASTATTVLAFVPMALLPGPAGDFVGSIAISVIVMLSVSFLLAMTVTPALAGMLVPANEKGRSWWRNGLQPGLAGRLFARSLDLALRYPRLAVLGALVLPIIGFGSFPTLTAQFFPGVERDQFYIQIELQEGTSLAETSAAAIQADAILRAEPEVTRTHWFVGESAPAFYYNMMTDQDGVPRFAEALVTTASEEAAESMLPRLQAALDRGLPSAQVIVRDLVQGPPVAAPVEVRLVGPELSVLRSLGEELRLRMANISGVTHTTATLLGGPPKLVLDLDEEKVRLTGLTLGQIARQMESLTEGATGGSLIEGSEELPVRVRVGEVWRSGAEQIAALEVLRQGGEIDGETWRGIPLQALGEMRLVPSDSPIARRNGERINTVQAYVALGVLPEEALKVLQQSLVEQPLALPLGYRIEYGGDSDARAETIRNLLSPIGLVVALMVVSLVLTFNSYRLAAVAGVVSVLSMGLSVLALAVFGYPFGIQAVIGVIGSIGVSINAAIIIMTALQQDPAALRGEVSAIRRVVLAASRHILSTTITTFGGFLPLILEGGGFWPPFAMSIAGGVLLSTVVSFYFVPPMFRLVMGVSQRPPLGQERALRDLREPSPAMTIEQRTQ